jgi:uncharacterized protein (TIGR02588 family)
MRPDAREQERHEGRGEAARRPEIPALEWATAIAGAILLAGALAFMVRQALVSDGEPGPVTFVVKEVRSVGSGFLVEVEARNRGGATYAELEVEGTLRDASGSAERATVRIDYLPPGSAREAGLFFRSDPARGRLELAPKGFRAP